MITVTRTGPRAAAIAADMRALPGKTVPLVAAKALTFTAQKAQQSIIAEMGRTFEGGATRFTLGGTRIESATPQKLQARVAVKDKPASGGNRPESALFPQVFGGPRAEKGMERQLRRMNLLVGGERAVPSQLAPLDALGNYRPSQLRALLEGLTGVMRVRVRSGRRVQAAVGKRTDLFVGQPGKPGSLPGVYRRVAAAGGRTKLQPLLIFVSKPPRYTAKLDFAGVAQDTAQREFEPTFARLLRAATS